MTSTIWPRALATTLAACGLMVAGCSQNSSDVADTGGADPSAVTRATDSADAGAAPPGARQTGAGYADTSSSVVSTARSRPSPATGLGPSLGSDPGAATPPPGAGASSSAAQSSGTTGRATGPR